MKDYSKYEEHNKKILDKITPYDFPLILCPSEFDYFEESGMDMNNTVVSLPLSIKER